MSDWLPLVPLVVAAVSLVGVLMVVWQKSVSDRKDQWWKRTQWALERAVSDDPAQAEVGLAVLDELADSKLADEEDQRMIYKAAVAVLGPLQPEKEVSDA